MNFSQYTNKEITDVFELLKTSRQGINHQEAEKRLRVFGFNELKEKRMRAAAILIRHLKSPFFYLLFAAAIVAFWVGEKVDGYVILTFVLLNVLLGFFQEFRSERAISSLKKYMLSFVRVIREGKDIIIDKKLLAPGDMVFLEAGNVIPADLRAVETQDFLVDESALTGESAPVFKNSGVLSKETKEIFKASNILFAGTSVISGKAQGIIIGTGKHTVLGEIAKTVSGISRESLYEKNLLNVSKLIMRIVVAAILFIFLANLIIRGTTNILDFLIFCIALIVSILPEALPVIITFALSQGALKLAKEKVIVRRLSAIEDLGNIEVLCVDKTGTLTQNKLTLENIYSSNKNQCFLYGLLNSHYIKESNSNTNSFDSAIFEKTPEFIKQEIKKFKLLAEVPFDSFRMRSNVLAENERGEKLLIVKGAAEFIFPLCSSFIGAQKKEELEQEIKQQGILGKRILTIAFKKIAQKYPAPLETGFAKDNENNLTFLGYFSFSDPLKDTAEEAIRLAKKLGVQVKIITGDSKEIAGSIAKKVGLIAKADEVISGEDLEKLPPDDFEKSCVFFSVFARISPETKHRIIETLQKKQEVGFIGEGINDAPALKSANVGIVVQETSDIAREVSDIVLLQKNLKVVIYGIKNGRTIFNNINKYIKCALASNFGNFYSIAVISLFIPFLPMLPVQILLGNLLSDFPLIAIATDYIDVEELKRPKIHPLRQMISLIIVLALVSTIFDFIFFAIFHNQQPSIMRTLWFIESILTEIALIFSVRTSHFFLKAKRPSLPLIAFTSLTAVFIVALPFMAFGQTAFHFVAPPIGHLLIVLLLVLFYFAFSEITKLAYFHFFNPWKIKDASEHSRSSLR